MIRYLRHTEIDRVKWDAAITHFRNGNFSAYSFYLDLVSPGWEALIEDDYESVMPLTQKIKYGIHYLFNPFFVNQLGLFSNSFTTDKFDRFLSAIPEQFRFIRIGVNAGCPVPSNGFTSIEKRCQVISLAHDYAKISDHYSENLIRNLKKSKNKGLIISDKVSSSQIVALFKAGRGDALGHFTEHEYDMLRSVFDSLLNNNVGFMRACFSRENELLAAAFFAKSHNTITYLKGGSSIKGKDSGAMHFLMDNVLQEFAGQNLIFDFGGSSVPNVERFNKMFGAADYFYQEIKRNTLPFYLKWLKS